MGTSVDTRRNISNTMDKVTRQGLNEIWGSGAPNPGSDQAAMIRFQNHFVQGYQPQLPIYMTPNKVQYPVVDIYQAANAGGASTTATFIPFTQYSNVNGGGFIFKYNRG